jgi:multisubunit Na+/H+ antiporter MnhC subunit
MDPVIIPYVLDVTSPTILIKSPENKTYTVNDVALTFTVNELTSWISYSLDGKDNVSIIGNITLSGLSNGLHNMTVYVTDTAGNTGASETIYFTIINETEPEPSEPFPTILVLGAIVITAVAVASVIIYLIRKRKK